MHSKVIEWKWNLYGCHGVHIAKAAKLVFKNNPPLDRPNTPCQFQRNLWRHSKVFEWKGNSKWLPYWKSCTAGFCKQPSLWKVKHTLSISKESVKSLTKLLSRNEIQDGCHGGHIEKAAQLVLENNPPLDRPNTPCQFQRNRWWRSKVIERKGNSKWLPWWLYWKNCVAS